MKTAISMPDEVFRTADRFARRQHVSRSALITEAVQEFLAHHRQDDVTEQLDCVYGQSESAVDPDIARLQERSVPREEW